MTVQNVRIVRLDPQANLLFIEGAIPGAEQGVVVVRKSKKRFEVVKVPQAVQEIVEGETGKTAKTAVKPKKQ